MPVATARCENDSLIQYQLKDIPQVVSLGNYIPILFHGFLMSEGICIHSRELPVILPAVRSVNRILNLGGLPWRCNGQIVVRQKDALLLLSPIAQMDGFQTSAFNRESYDQLCIALVAQSHVDIASRRKEIAPKEQPLHQAIINVCADASVTRSKLSACVRKLSTPQAAAPIGAYVTYRDPESHDNVPLNLGVREDLLPPSNAQRFAPKIQGIVTAVIPNDGLCKIDDEWLTVDRGVNLDHHILGKKAIATVTELPRARTLRVTLCCSCLTIDDDNEFDFP